MESTADKIAFSKGKIDGYDGELKVVVEELTQLMDRIRAEADLLNKIDKKKNEIDSLSASIFDLKKNSEILDESKENLERKLTDLINKLDRAAEFKSELESSRIQLQHSLTDLSRQISCKMTEKGLVLAQLTALDNKIAHRNSCLVAAAKAYNIPMADVVSDQVHKEVLAALAQLSKEACITVQNIHDEQRLEEQKLADEGHQLLSQLTTAQQFESTKRRAIESCLNRQSQLSNQLNQFATNFEDPACIKMQEEHESRSLAIAKQSLIRGDFENVIRAKENERKTIEADNIKDRQALNKLSTMSELVAKLSLKKLEKSKKEQHLAQFTEKWIDDISQVLHCTVSDGNFESLLESKKLEHTTELFALKKKIDELTTKKLASDNSAEFLKKQLSKITDLLESKSKKLESLIGSHIDFNVQYELSSNSLNDVQSSINKLTQRATVFQDFLEKSKVINNCPLCHRGFDNPADRDALLNELTDALHSSPKKLQDLRDEESKLKSYLGELMKAKPLVSDIAELSGTEIPALKADIVKINEERLTLEECLPALLKEKNEKEKLINLIDSLCLQGVDHAKYTKELRTLNAEISFIESDISLSLGPAASSLLTVDELSKKIQDNEVRVSSLNEEISHLSDEFRNKQREVQMRELRLRDIVDKLKESQREEAEKISLEKDRERLKQDIYDMEEEIRCQKKHVEELEPKLAEIQVKKNELMQSYADKASLAQVYSKDVEKARSGLEVIYEDIEKLRQLFPTISPTDAVVCLDAAIKDLETRVTEKQKILQQLDQEASDRSKILSEIQLLERNIRDNLRIREMEDSLKRLNVELACLQSSSSSSSSASYDDQLSVLKARQSELMTERAGLLGELRQLEDQFLRLNKELSSDYKDAQSEYEQMVINVKTTELLLVDLDKYGKALDNAIMKYHSLKMEEINKIIRELWVNTYQGSDIDTIEIRSDAENTKGNRSYNYRVVMIKSGDTELDMRGRSSAGQRVLTSLIIRLALAETFGLSCGILALDEPTTNLDRANIESLAESLVNIIKSRRAQSNFQLIVITHDEDFVSMLGRSEYLDYYWKLARDDKQHSYIEKISAN